MKFLDLFAGIGGFRLGLEQAGHQCVGFCEIDKFARKSYKAIHNTENEVEMHDITEITDDFIRGIGNVDIITGGFPCQAFSIAGKRRGFSDTRGTLFFEIARFASILKPEYLLLENVKGLLSHDSGNTFEVIISTLDELGYDVEWQVLNSKEYVPQNRERVFIVGHLRGAGTRKIFPFEGDGKAPDREFKIEKIGNIRKNEKSQSGDVVSQNSIAPTLCSTTTQKDPLKVAIPVMEPERVNKSQNGRRFKENGEEMFTLTAQGNHGIIVAGHINPNGFRQTNEVLDPSGICTALRTFQGGGLEPKIKVREATKKGYSEAVPGDSVNVSHPDSKTRRGRVGKQIANTLLTGEEQATVTADLRIRKLTPRECWRLQGFPDWAFDRAEKVNSNSQLYKQAGNSVTVPVIFDIARRLIK